MRTTMRVVERTHTGARSHPRPAGDVTRFLVIQERLRGGARSDITDEAARSDAAGSDDARADLPAGPSVAPPRPLRPLLAGPVG